MSSCASSAGKRSLLLFIGIMALAVCGLAQQAPKKSKAPAATGKPAAAATPTPAKSESAGQSTAPAAAAAEEPAQEPQGPWHGLTWRLIGPFRGGGGLAVGGVGGAAPTNHFGGAGGGGWWRTGRGPGLGPPERKRKKNVAP